LFEYVAGKILCFVYEQDRTPAARICCQQMSVLMLGTTPHHTATLVLADDRVLVELRSYPDSISVTGRRSIEEYLEQGR
jgi:hypothetical protein